MTGLDGINSLEKIVSSLSVTDRKSSAVASHAVKAPPVQDQAQVSSAATLAGTTSDVRQEKVQALRQAIADGTYSVSSKAVAGKIVDTLVAQG